MKINDIKFQTNLIEGDFLSLSYTLKRKIPRFIDIEYKLQKIECKKILDRKRKIMEKADDQFIKKNLEQPKLEFEIYE